MEIERKYTIKQLPENLDAYPVCHIEQGYLCTDPVIRIRKEDESYFLTCKGKGLMAREEYNLPLHKEAYEHLCSKTDGHIISKKRYRIPLVSPKFKEAFPPNEASEKTQALKEPFAASSLTIELDIFEPPFAPLIMAEIEFPSVEMADAYLKEDWFLADVTNDVSYHNSNMSKRIIP